MVWEGGCVYGGGKGAACMEWEGGCVYGVGRGLRVPGHIWVGSRGAREGLEADSKRCSSGTGNKLTHAYTRAQVGIDVVKHAVLGKFNDVRPGIYREFHQVGVQELPVVVDSIHNHSYLHSPCRPAGPSPPRVACLPAPLCL